MSAKRERRKVSSENGRKPGSCCCARSYIIIYGAGRKDRIYTAKWKRKSVRMWGKWVKEKRQAGEIERGKSLSFDTAYKILDKLSALWWSGLGGKRSLDNNQGALRVSRQKSRQQAAGCKRGRHCRDNGPRNYSGRKNDGNMRVWKSPRWRLWGRLVREKKGERSYRCTQRQSKEKWVG